MPTRPSPTETPFDRRRALSRLAAQQFDVLVVGGGITGAGVALDAAARGLRTALVERHDFASGTSSKSSKMVHGGLRYLQHGDVRLVYEALHERQRLLRNAPHLVTPLPFLIPLFGRNGVVNAGLARAYATALWLYDVTGGWRIGRWHRRISQAEALGHLPALRTDRLVAGFVYFDARVDDARLTLAVVRTAVVDFGAVAANYTEAVSLRHDGGGAVTGAVVRPRHGDEMEVRARVVVNATGVWADEVRSLDEGSHTRTTRPAKGVHVTVPSNRLPADIAAVLPVPGDRRSIFVVPWADGEDTYVGTTDTAWDGPLDRPACTADDVDYLLDAVNAATTAAIERHEVTGVWAGLRPLLDPGASGSRSASASTRRLPTRRLPTSRRARRASERTADLSRRHQVMTSSSGVVTVTGGKLTTYRLMAEDTVDEVVRLLGPWAPPVSRRCPTRRLALHGAPATRADPLPSHRAAPTAPTAPTAPHHATADIHATADTHPASAPDAVPAIATAHDATADLWASHDRTLPAGIDPATSAALRARYGTEWLDVLALAADRPDLLRPLVAGLPYLRVEVLWAATQEMAQTVEDVLSRRTRTTLRQAQAAAEVADEVADLLASALDRPIDELHAEAETFARAVRADLEHAGIPTTTTVGTRSTAGTATAHTAAATTGTATAHTAAATTGTATAHTAAATAGTATAHTAATGGGDCDRRGTAP